MSDRYQQTVEQLFSAVGTTTGRAYLERFVLQLAQSCRASFAAVAVLDDDPQGCLRSLAVSTVDQLSGTVIWPLPDSPGAQVIDGERACSFRSNIRDKFPHDPVLRRIGMDSYIGVPLFASCGEVLGLIIIMDRGVIAEDLFVIDVAQLFADRVVAEIERLAAESAALGERKQAETRVRRCQSDLHDARKELETFTYAVSHDLRGPLRAISGFSEVLVGEYGDRLDELGHDYLQRIRSNAGRMSELIGALASLSRIVRHELQPSRVSLSRLCSEVLERLQRHDPARRVTLRIQPDVYGYGDHALLLIALEHLLENAWKFSRHVDPAEISFVAEQQDGKTVYRLTDNGAGFEMAYADKLFELFQRLHRQETFEGSGAGLAIVRRIIEKHRGSIWAQGAEGRGTSIYFTLPEPPPVGSADA